MSIPSTGERLVKRRKTSHDSGNQSGHVDRSEDKAGTKNFSGGMRSQKELKGSTEHVASSNRTLQNTNSNMSGGNMTRSSIMAIQATELIAQVSCDCPAKLRELQSEIDDVIQAIKDIPERPAASLLQAEKALKQQGFAIPFLDHRPKSDIKYSFAFLRSHKVRLRGKLAAGIATNECRSVEIGIEMPSSTFQEKDYLNHRVFHKRAFYVACIAAGLSGSLNSRYDIHYALKHGNSLLPIIQLTLKSAVKGVEQTNMMINVFLPHSLGPIAKTLPAKNCVRSTDNAHVISEEGIQPTPFYNSTLRWAASAFQFDQLIQQSLQSCASFKDACILGQVWLRQRGLASSVAGGGFGAEEWAVTMALLLAGGGHQGRSLFSTRYTSIQLFKAMLQVLSNRDLIENPLVIGEDQQLASSPGIPLLFDAKNGVNLLFKMSTWSFSKLRHVARLSLGDMNSRNQNNFQATFILKSSDILLQFDESYSIEISSQTTHSSKSERDFLGQLHAILKRGLSDRVQLIDIGTQSALSWDPSRPGPNDSNQTIQLSLIVNPDAAVRTLDHGPTAEEQDEAEGFREFWGDKSELRRFRDGRITETLVWSDSSPITHQIIQYLALFHFSIPSSSIKRTAADHQIASLRGVASIGAADAFKIINTRYQELATTLHHLDGLPLPIRSVSPSDPCLRSAAIANPLAPSTAQTIDILVQFDSSTRWPDHLPAIQYTKIAFLAKLAELLREAQPKYSSRIGIEQSKSSGAGYFNTSFLDVVESAPAPGLAALVFRIRIHHDREQQLLQEQLSSVATAGNTREDLTSALTTFKRNFVASPNHTMALRNLITHFAPLSDTIRLFKTWIASHHLTNHLPEAVLEMISAYVYLRPAPWTVPGTSTTGFLRCLHFLAHWDWITTPLIVDLSLSQDMSISAYTDLETRFQAWRKLDPAMNKVSWFIGTNIDNTGTVWTQDLCPSRVIGARVTVLAKASIELTRARGLSMEAQDWESLFQSGVDEFDFVIHLKASVVKGAREPKAKNGQIKYKNLVLQEELDTDKIGHDVVQLYLADLERLFASSLLFFHGYGGTVITGLWRPNTSGEKEWRVRLGYSSVPVAKLEADDAETAALCKINKAGILAEIGNLGKGMVERIEIKR